MCGGRRVALLLLLQACWSAEVLVAVAAKCAMAWLPTVAGVLTCGGGNLRVPARDERTGRAKQGGP